MRSLEDSGHNIKICVRERENIVRKLLELYGFNYENLEKNSPGLYHKAITMYKNDYKLMKISNAFDPDIFVSITSPYSAHVSKLKRKPFIAFTDSEPTPLILSLTIPFTDTVITPTGFQRDFGRKHIRISGFKELAYLHPNSFKPNLDVLDMLNLAKDDKYVILRFNSFDSSHDIGKKGFSLENKRKLVHEIEKYSRVFISSELGLPADLEKYSMNIAPNKMHDALYYSSLLVTDAQTSTTEAACLGTPAIRCNSFVGKNDMSNFIELEEKYELISNFNNFKDTITKSIEIINISNIKYAYISKREQLLRDKIDVTKFLIWFIENYPESFRITRENPKYHKRFK